MSEGALGDVLGDVTAHAELDALRWALAEFDAGRRDTVEGRVRVLTERERRDKEGKA